MTDKEVGQYWNGDDTVVCDLIRKLVEERTKLLICNSSFRGSHSSKMKKTAENCALADFGIPEYSWKPL